MRKMTKKGRSLTIRRAAGMGLGVLSIVIIAIVLLLRAQEAEQSDQPASITAQMDKIFEKWDKPDSPGCAFAVIKDGRIVYKHGYGMANLDHDVPITPSTVFYIASVSKQFTAAAIALLAQQGKLSLDDEVRNYVPELPDFGSPITIRHLIHHTSGLPTWGAGGTRLDDELELVSRLKELNFPPGEKFLYSNRGYRLLALIVGRVSGQSLRAFTRAEIFEPLGMKNTHFRDDHGEIVKHLAYGYEPAKGDAFRRTIFKSDIVGAGGLLSTVEDLALWQQNFYDQRVGGHALIEQLHQRGRLNNGEELEYAFGLVIREYRGLPIVEHGGYYLGYRTQLMRFPEQRFSVACLCNASTTLGEHPWQLARKVTDIYLAKELKEPADEETVQLSEPQLASKVGLYWNRERDGFRKIFMKEGKLHLIFPGEDESYEMKALSENRFRLVLYSLMEVRFEPVGTGGPLRLTQTIRGRSPESFEPVAQFTPTRRELYEYVGTYVSDEIDIIYRAGLEDDKLVLKRQGDKPAILQPALRDVFSAPDWSLRFTRDANNQVTGVVLNNYRNRNFRFTKKTL